MKEQIYHAEAIYDKLIETLMKDSQILRENKEAIKLYLSRKSAEGVTTVRLNIIFAGLLRIVRLSHSLALLNHSLGNLQKLRSFVLKRLYLFHVEECSCSVLRIFP